MTPDRIPITLGGVGFVGFLAWLFWLKRTPGVKASIVSSGYQEQIVLVKGGYTPDTIRVAAYRLVRLLFLREETAASSEQVVITDFGKPASLPAGTVVPIEFMPGAPGEHEFSRQLGMLRGRIIVEAA